MPAKRIDTKAWNIPTFGAFAKGKQIGRSVLSQKPLKDLIHLLGFHVVALKLKNLEVSRLMHPTKGQRNNVVHMVNVTCGFVHLYP